MGNITARIAAKLATSAWWIAVADETTRVVFELVSDNRFVAAVAGAVGHFAERTGLDAQARSDLIRATEEACRAAFPLLPTPEARLRVSVTEFSDRVEVTLEHQGPPTSGEGLATAWMTGGRDLERLVDRVQSGTRGGTFRTLLVKYVRAPAGAN